MRPLNDNDLLPSSSKAVGHQELSEMAERHLAEWAQAEQEDQRRREADDRAKLGVFLLAIIISGASALGAVYSYAGGLG